MIGSNILDQFLADPQAHLDWLSTSQAGAVLIMDNPARAQQIKRLLPNAAVVHRTYSPHDAHWHDRRADGSWTFPPAKWIADHRGTVGNGAYCQVFNEPAPVNLDAFFRWLEELVAAAPDVPLALPAWAVGNPHDKDITAGVYDRLLRLLRKQDALLVHEYFKDDPRAEYPWLCGRFEFWLDRAEALDLPPPTILVGEYGRDVAGGINDGFRGAGWSPAFYGRLLVDTHRAIYLPHRVRTLVFAVGRGADGRWQSWNVEGEEEILEPIAEYNAMTVAPLDERQAVVVAPFGLNLRPDTSTDQTPLVKIPLDATFTVWLSPVVEANGYQWVNAAYDGKQGFVAVSVNGAATYKIKEAAPPDPDDPAPIYSVWLTRDEMQQDLELELEAARLHQAAGQIEAQLEANAKKRAELLRKAIDRAT